MKALIIIDVQNGLTSRKLYQKQLFFDTINASIALARSAGDAVIFIQYNNKQLAPDMYASNIDKRLNRQEDDAVFTKTKGNAFSSSDLVLQLQTLGIRDITVAGLVTHGCIKHTCLGGLKLGYSISLLHSGHTCWNTDAEEKIVNTESELKILGVNVV